MDDEDLDRWQAESLLERLAKSDKLAIKDTRTLSALARDLALLWRSVDGPGLASFLRDRNALDGLYVPDQALAYDLELARNALPRRIPTATPEPVSLSLNMNPAQQISRLMRSYWLPITIPDEIDNRSRFGGRALLRANESWPICPNCDESMQFFLQLQLSQLPNELRWPHDSGFVQVFYCTSQQGWCEIECKSWLPQAESVIARFIPENANELVATMPPPGCEETRARSVVSWVIQEGDFPCPGEAEANQEVTATLADPKCQSIVAAERLRASGHEKVGGWPHWLDEAKYPKCPECNSKMDNLMQLTSHGLTGHSFGAGGIAHLMQCPHHAEAVALIWESR